MIIPYSQATTGELRRRYHTIIETIDAHLTAWLSARDRGCAQEADKHREYLETVVYVLGRDVYESLTGRELSQI